jgi:hypothetical protein
MINLLGKFLVYVNTGLSIIFLIFAVWLFNQPEDIGRKDPRKTPGGERVPSVLDQRIAALEKYTKPKADALIELKQAQMDLRASYYKWPTGHLWMKKELEKLQSEPGNIAKKQVDVDWAKRYPMVFKDVDTETTVREVQVTDGAIAQKALNFPVYKTVMKDGNPTMEKIEDVPYPVGVPVLDLEIKVKYTAIDPKTGQISQKEVEIDKSMATYQEELGDLKMRIKEVSDAIYLWAHQQKTFTVYLNGGQVMFPNWWLAIHSQTNPLNQLAFMPDVLAHYGRDTIPAPEVPGLYNLLLVREKEMQDKMKEEIDHIRPQWVRILIDSQLQLERQKNLQLRVEELKTQIKERQPEAGK